LSNRGVLLIDRRGLLTNGQGLLINKGILVRILSSKGITVRNLRFRRAPARKINPKAALAHSLSLIKWIDYKAKILLSLKEVKGLLALICS
jgi:hypothetical protein